MAKKMTFEAALAELESIVDALERGDLSLEESMAKYEEGVGLAARCAELLKTAETRVRELVKRAEGSFELLTLEGTGEGEAGDGDTA
jgi:exodeoxyribonuclease VII small subunit